MVDVYLIVVLSVSGLFFLYTGVSSFLRPVVLGRLLGIDSVGRSGKIEIQAQYGGFFFACGLSVIASVLGVIEIGYGLFLTAVTFGGLTLGRLLALFEPTEDRHMLPTIRALYWVDGLGFVLALVGLSTMPVA